MTATTIPVTIFPSPPRPKIRTRMDNRRSPCPTGKATGSPKTITATVNQAIPATPRPIVRTRVRNSETATSIRDRGLRQEGQNRPREFSQNGEPQQCPQDVGSHQSQRGYRECDARILGEVSLSDFLLGRRVEQVGVGLDYRVSCSTSATSGSGKREFRDS